MTVAILKFVDGRRITVEVVEAAQEQFYKGCTYNATPFKRRRRQLLVRLPDGTLRRVAEKRIKKNNDGTYATS